MTTETKHTPTPWHLGYKGEGHQTISGNRDVELGKVQWSEFAKVVIEVDGKPEPIGEANAAFIVRACNAHDELMALLADIHHAEVFFQSACIARDFIDADKWENARRDAFAKIPAALAKARGEA